MSDDDFGPLLGSALGLFCIVSACTNWKRFWGSPLARPVIDGFGKTGARVFYIIFGLVIVALSSYVFTLNRR